MAALSFAQVKWVYRELGLQSLFETGRDAKIIILARCSRMLAFGTSSLVLALFFSALKFSDLAIGLFMTLTLLGDVLLSLVLTLVADRVGRRRILFGGSFLMILSGATFALCENFWVLLFAAVVGVISASGGDYGPFRAIEESTLSQLTTQSTRPDVFAWYVTLASVGSAVGTEASGRVVHYLQHRDGWTLLDAYHVIFWVYSAMGTVNLVLTLLLTDKCEANVRRQADPGVEEAEVLMDHIGEQEGDDEDHEQQQRLSSGPKTGSQPPPKQGMFAQISKSTRYIMYKLWFLLVVDALADGMTSYSLTVYYMDQKLHPKKSTLGDILSTSYILSSCSSIFAGPLSRHLGLIKTMVFTHLPSSAAVLLFSAPQGLWLTVALFFIRAGLNNMDQAPRAAFIAAVVKADERTAVMGITGTLRTLAAVAGPSVTGLLAGNDKFWIAFVVAGSLRISYDLGLFAMFVNMRLDVHEKDPRETAAPDVELDLRSSADEEEARGSR